MDIRGGVALVSGGASGLGRATVERLHTAGAAVVLLDLPGQQGQDVVASLGERAVFAPADVTDEQQVAAAVEAAVALGELRVVVNCAGIGPPGKLVGRDGPLALDVFRRVLEVNLVGTFNVTRLAVAAMLERDLGDAEERGVVVNTASVAAFDGQVGQPAYAASKGGVVALTLPLARELAPARIRVNTIAPGLFMTPLFATLPEEAIASLAAQVPHPARLGDPDEYARLVEHMVANPMLNGETVRLDGAIRMAPR